MLDAPGLARHVGRPFRHLQGGFELTDAFLRPEGKGRPKPAGGPPRAARRSLGVLSNMR